MPMFQPTQSSSLLNRGTVTHLVKRITARVFVHPTHGDGGNPVTIFHFHHNQHQRQQQRQNETSPLSPSRGLFQKLAKSCDWESVIIHNDKFSFYLPNGDDVSFCAHAAIAGCHVLNWRNETQVCPTPVTFTTQGKDETSTTTHLAVVEDDGIIGLTLPHDVHELSVDKDVVQRLLEEIRLEQSDIIVSESLSPLPSSATNALPLVNSSAVIPYRYKTLIPLQNAEAVHRAQNPKRAHVFRQLCDLLSSTGVYLYSPSSFDDGDGSDPGGASLSSSSWECRQFPRASGYPEDPATGVAAAALAGSLRRRGYCGEGGNVLRFYQGRRMGMLSEIGIEFLKDGGGMLCKGRVNILDEVEEVWTE